MHAKVVGKFMIGEYRLKAVTGAKTTGRSSEEGVKVCPPTRQISPVTSTGGEPRLNPSAHRSLRVDRVSCG